MSLHHLRNKRKIEIKSKKIDKRKINQYKIVKFKYIMTKELLVVFKAFCTWHYYLEGSELPIDIITYHKYFLTTKVLFYYQVK